MHKSGRKTAIHTTGIRWKRVRLCISNFKEATYDITHLHFYWFTPPTRKVRVTFYIYLFHGDCENNWLVQFVDGLSRHRIQQRFLLPKYNVNTIFLRQYTNPRNKFCNRCDRITQINEILEMCCNLRLHLELFEILKRVIYSLIHSVHRLLGWRAPGAGNGHQNVCPL